MSLASVLAGLRRAAATAATSPVLARVPAAAWRPPANSSVATVSLPFRRTAATWGRPRACRSISVAASAEASAAASGAAVQPSTEVGAAIRAACERLGRPFPEAAVAALQDNWYTTAAELTALPDETARSLGVPLRLKAEVAQVLAAAAEGADSSGSGGSSSSAALAAAPAQARQAEQPAGDGSSSSQDGAVSEEDARIEAAAARSAAAAAAAAAWDQAHLSIEQRRCPPIRRFGHSYSSAPKVTTRQKAERYALSADEISPALAAEFEAFHRFNTVRFFGAQADPISDVTSRKYCDHMRGLLGWLHREKGVPLEQLSFKAALPSSGREGVALLFEYLLWLSETRGVSVRTEGIAIRSAGAAAKFLYHAESKVNPGLGDRAYSDLEVVKELRAMSNAARKRAKVAPRAADEELKWLSWPEYLQLCGELRRECAALDAAGRPRSPTAVAWSLQRYLVFAIFSCVPDRQRTVRELEVGRTLVRDREGRWVIKHGPGDYKTGRAYGERPPLVLSPHIYPELEAFMGRWRAELKPAHNLLFTQHNGAPFTDKNLYKTFWSTAYRLTGKKANPHLIRDSVVTYLRGSGASERELEALALYMGHSIEMQRGTYDRRTKEQKVEPAVELLASLNARAMGGGGGGLGSGSEA